MRRKVVITSGYFNPIHPGHIQCFQMCRELGDELWVIVNNDKQARLKTGKQELFQDEKFRMSVVSALKDVDFVMLAVDNDASVCESIKKISSIIRDKYGDIDIIFGKGGDRFAGNIPELQICEELGIIIKDGLGAKVDHSSYYRNKII